MLSPGMMTSPDFNNKLQQKMMDYEDLVKKLTAENEDFSTQIRQLSQQIESLHPKNQLSSSYGSGKKSVTISAHNASPNTRGSNGNNASREISLELESMFMNAEYKKAVELLTQIDYKKPYNIPTEKFSNWLIIGNRMKDSSFNDILSKLKILMTFVEKEEDDDDTAAGLDDSLDKPNYTTAEKIYLLLDEKLPKVILRSEYKLETKKLKDRSMGISDLADDNFGTRSRGREEDETNLTNEQLRGKIQYLNTKLEQLEKVIY